jgi:DNA-directed RNA polymerase specialized sigma24 family protein
VRVPTNDQEDIVQDVLFKLVMRNPDLPLHAGPKAVARYVRKMLANRWLDRTKRQRRAEREANEIRSNEQLPFPKPVLAAEDLPSSSPDAESIGRDLDGRRAVDQAKQDLNALYLVALDARAPRYRAPLEVAWRQMTELLYGDRSLRDIVREEAGGVDLDEGDFIRHRNRLFTNHKRLREALDDAVNRLERAGTWDIERADYHRRLLMTLVRCQRSEQDGVQETEGPVLTGALEAGTP